MKTLTLSLLSCFVLFIGFGSLAADKVYEWMDYQLLKSTADPQLDENHAVFELQFEQWLIDEKVKIELSCNGVIQRFTADSINHELTVSPGTYTFEVFAGKKYLEIQTGAILIQPGFRTVIAFYFRSSDNENMKVRKPVIYAYSDHKQPIDLTIDPAGSFTFTYPQAQNGHWSGIVQTDGTIEVAGKTYPYLFWEGTDYNLARLMDYSEGTVLNTDEVIPFLEQQLTTIGFNDQEKTDFITFWGPIMVASERGFAHFLVNEEYDNAIAELKLQPQADHIYRLYLLWEPLSLETNYSPKPQVLPVLERGGLTIVEWGGSLIAY